jgi:hypothetical protein
MLSTVCANEKGDQVLNPKKVCESLSYFRFCAVIFFNLYKRPVVKS